MFSIRDDGLASSSSSFPHNLQQVQGASQDIAGLGNQSVEALSVSRDKKIIRVRACTLDNLYFYGCQVCEAKPAQILARNSKYTLKNPCVTFKVQL